MNDMPTMPGEPMPAIDDAMLEQAAVFLSLLTGCGDDETLRGEAAATFQAWLAEAPLHAVAADIVSRSWQAAGDVDLAVFPTTAVPVLSPVVPVKTGTQPSAANLPEGIRKPGRRGFAFFARPAAPAPGTVGSPLSRGRQQRRRAAKVAIAACALLAAGIWLWRAETVMPVTYQTARGEQSEIVLADGSTLRLNVATTLRVRVTWRARQVTLDEGEAEFVVAHDRLRPFTVAADRVMVRAIGTDFVVGRRDEGSFVLLVSGSVALADPGSDTVRAILKPGQKATYDAQTSPVIRNVTVADELAWQKGRVVFDRTPLAAALRILQRHADARVSLPADLEQVQISGMYRTGDLPAFLESIARILPVAWSRDDDGAYRIARRDKK